MADGRRWLLLALLTTSAHGADVALPALGVARDISVSGLSAGAHMAVQYHIAHAREVHGVAALAGGPYYCAEGRLALALGRCMRTVAGVPDTAALAATVRRFAEAGEIDPPAALGRSQVFIFRGDRDPVVASAVVAATASLYRALGVPARQIHQVTDPAAGHVFPTPTAGESCGRSVSPYLGACGRDLAGELLQALYGPLQLPATSPGGQLLTVAQDAVLAGMDGHGLAARGWLWVPAGCAAGGCRLHVVFHGCRQSGDDIGERFVREAGYNRWADANRLVVFYPQVRRTLTNPLACWNWYGQGDPAYHTRSGRQQQTIAALVARLQQAPGK